MHPDIAQHLTRLQDAMDSLAMTEVMKFTAEIMDCTWWEAAALMHRQGLILESERDALREWARIVGS